MPIRVALLIAAALLLAVSSQATVDPCNGRLDEVRDGNVVIVEREPTDGSGVAIEACGRVEAAPEDVWPVVINCESFEDFLPSVDRSALLHRRDGVSVCETWIDLPFPLDDLHSVTRNEERALSEGGFHRSWTLTRGNYARNNGSWTVLPWPGEGSGTLLVYRVDIDPSNFVPDFILRRLQAGTAPDVFAAVRDRVDFCRENADEPACRARGDEEPVS